MEPIVVLLVLGVLFVVFGLPIWAMATARRTARRGEELSARFAELETTLARLEQRLRAPAVNLAESSPASADISSSAPASSPTSAPASEPVPIAESREFPESVASVPLSVPVAPPPLPVGLVARSAEPEPEPKIGVSSALPPQMPSPAPAPTSPSPRFEPPRQFPKVNWEQLMGVKLFAWLGGFALFLAAAYFVKYSFDNNLIPPAVRMALGFLTGLGLLGGGVMLQRKQYAVTSQTLCATGVVILYAVTFGCRAIYHFAFFGPKPTFLLMVLITATAFLLAVRMPALVVAVLGMLGGFLAPILLSTGQDNPLGLFVYLAILDAGLIAVALHRRWNFLVLAGAVGTAILEWGWIGKFFEAGRYFEGAKIFVPLAVFVGFSVLFLLAFVWAKRRGQSNRGTTTAALGMPAITLALVFFLLTFPALGARPGVLFLFVLGADLCLLALAWLEPKLHAAHLAGGAAAFLALSVWTLQSLSAPLLTWALGLYFVFALLHAVYPVVLQRLRPASATGWWGHLFPPLALVLVMLPMFKFGRSSMLVWPFVLLVDVLAIGLAVVTSSVLSIVAVLLLTLGVIAVSIFRTSANLAEVPVTLWMIGGFAMFFCAAGIFAGRRMLMKGATGNVATGAPPWLQLQMPGNVAAQIPSLSLILPFLLLIMLMLQMPLTNPSPVFGLALLLTVLLLGVARAFRLGELPAVGLACVLALQHAWHFRHFAFERAPLQLAWHLGFFAIFAVFPFLFLPRFVDKIVAWAAAALAGPLHFYLIHQVVKAAYPNNFMGALPAAFALPALAGLAFLLKRVTPEQPSRLSQLAWFGGVALFFITLIFPIQFDRQWITLGWALEGAALCWLFHRVPHPGLRLAGVALLLVAFARLAANPAVLSYHSRASTPILNWYLYAYGLAAVCLVVGARWLAPPRNLVLRTNVPPILYGLAVVLVFFLVNIEIADYFTTPGASVLTFQFSGHFARDMTYTIAWALFAFGLLVLGIWKRVPAARYASLALLGVTLLKLFFHDLAQLRQLYRIGALVAVAVIAILASFLYQRFVPDTGKKSEPEKPPSMPPPPSQNE